MFKQIYLISGKAGSGKDTVAEILYEEFTNKGKKVKIKHFAAYLKELVANKKLIEKYEDVEGFMDIINDYRTQTGNEVWDGVKDVPGRTLLQKISGPLKKKYGSTFFSDIVLDQIEKDESTIFLIPDVRFASEIEQMFELSSMYKVEVVRIKRDNNDTLNTENQSHVSEIELDVFKYFNTVVENNGSIEELREKVKLLFGV